MSKKWHVRLIALYLKRTPKKISAEYLYLFDEQLSRLALLLAAL